VVSPGSDMLTVHIIGLQFHQPVYWLDNQMMLDSIGTYLTRVAIFLECRQLVQLSTRIKGKATFDDYE
jgi:hypothetical protein